MRKVLLIVAAVACVVCVGAAKLWKAEPLTYPWIDILYTEDLPFSSCSHGGGMGMNWCDDLLSVRVHWAKSAFVSGYVGLYDENWNWIDGKSLGYTDVNGYDTFYGTYHHASKCSCDQSGIWYHVSIQGGGSDAEEDWIEHASLVSGCLCP